MQLVYADLGNSQIKFYGTDGQKSIFSYEKTAAIKTYLKNSAAQLIFLSAVYRRGLAILSGFDLPLMKVDADFPFFFAIAVKEKHTIGTDRLINLEGLIQQGLTTDALVIDSGSAVTIDVLLTAAGPDKFTFPGGLIVPGAEMQEKALLAQTDIKNLAFQPSASDLLVGDNTSSAVHLGINNCLTYGLKGIITNLLAKYKIGHVFFTGGNKATFTSWVAGERNSRIIADYREDLNYWGLRSLAAKKKLI